jgi:hypothetical protein
MKKLTLFDSQKDEWYYQPKIYISTKSSNYLYSELSEFRSSLSRELSKKFVDNFDFNSLLNNEKEFIGRKSKKKSKNHLSKKSLNNLKLKKPVISFFTDKAKVLREEINKINNEMEVRKKIYDKFLEDIGKDLKEVRRLLHEISLYSPGVKHSIDLRRIDLERELLGLSREVRISRLSLWKDLVFLRRELREIIFEYQALKRMAELVENGGFNNGVSR